MAVMTDTDRDKVSAKFNRELFENTALLKSQIKVLVNAADDFLDTSAATYNSSIPQPVRTLATTTEKVKALVLVLNERFNLGL